MSYFIFGLQRQHDNVGISTSHIIEWPEQRWHLPALPTMLTKLESISSTTLARLLLRSQQRWKEVSSATRSGKT